MAAGDVFEATTGSCEDLHYVDTGMYDSPEYGSVYVLDAERPAVIDTGLGTNYERIVDAIESVGLSLADIEVIAVTHVHLDHAGGAGFLARDCPNADVYVHEIGARHLVDPRDSSRGPSARSATSGSTTSNRGRSPRTGSSNSPTATRSIWAITN